MSFKYSELFPFWIGYDITHEKKLKGYIIFWDGYFIPEDHGLKLSSFLSCKLFLIDIYNKYSMYSIYKNKDINAPVVYIHDAESIGLGSHSILKTSGRLDRITNRLDISGIDLPETFTSLRIPRFPYTTCLPYISVKDISATLEILPFIEQKRYVSMILVCSLYHHGNSSSIKGRDILSLLEEYNVYIDEDNIDEYIHEGLGHFGYKVYTFDEILDLHGMPIQHNKNISGVFRPYKKCTIFDKDRISILYTTKHEYTTKHKYINIHINLSREDKARLRTEKFYNVIEASKDYIEKFFFE